MPTGAPTAIVPIVHDETLANAAEPQLDEITLGEASLEEHQLLELHLRLGVKSTISLVYVA